LKGKKKKKKKNAPPEEDREVSRTNGGVLQPAKAIVLPMVSEENGHIDWAQKGKTGSRQQKKEDSGRPEGERRRPR